LIDAIHKTVEVACKRPLHLHHIKLHDYGNHSELSCHIKLPPQMPLKEAHAICTKVEKRIYKDFGITATIHPEPLKVNI